jgi:aminopeptidase
VDASTQTSPSAVDAGLLERYADLLVGLGANVQEGQIVDVRANLEHAPLVRAIVETAYRRGARYVDTTYTDPDIRRIRVLYAAEETLTFAPPWERERFRHLGELRCARIALSPLMPPGLLDGVDPRRAGREPSLPEAFQLLVDRTTNWTVGPVPVRSWAARVHPELPEEDALSRLWDDIVQMCRLDAPDPADAWRERFAELAAVRDALNDARLDSLRYEGPGTDLTIGLLPSSIWVSGTGTTVDGIEHAPNIPTEEIFTAPDPERTEGVVASTKPLSLKGGALVAGLVVRFEKGRAVHVDAETGAEALREQLRKDEGAPRLGEVALVDGQSGVGRLGRVFWNTLLDENAAAHLALGAAYSDTVGDADRERINKSETHIDFMVGSDDVEVTGVTADGRSIPVLRAGAWQL